MREGIERVADALVQRWNINHTLELRSAELALVRAYLSATGVRVQELPDGRFEVETAGMRDACGAAQLVLIGLRRLLAARRQSPC